MNACSEDSMYVSSKARQPGYEKILILYKPKVDSVMLCAGKMHNYIQEIKQLLNSNSNDDNEFASNTQPTIKIKLISNELAKSLYDSLNSYSQLLLHSLPFKITYYDFTVPIDTSKQFSKNLEMWRGTYFDGLTGQAMLSSLTELDYQVWLSANKMTNIIRYQWSDDLIEYFNVYEPFVSQNSMYFLPGQTLEINVGLGRFSNDIKHKVIISGQQQLLNADGIAEYKKVVTVGKGGSIPIVITYTDPNTGEQQTVTKNISYTVFESPKNK